MDLPLYFGHLAIGFVDFRLPFLSIIFKHLIEALYICLHTFDVRAFLPQQNALTPECLDELSDFIALQMKLGDSLIQIVLKLAIRL